MLGVLPFGEDPDLSGTAGPAVPQHLPPWHQVMTSDCGPAAISKLKSQVADMLEPRSNFSVAVIDDRLMVMGGYR